MIVQVVSSIAFPDVTEDAIVKSSAAFKVPEMQPMSLVC
jgi:hypothetical protein